MNRRSIARRPRTRQWLRTGTALAAVAAAALSLAACGEETSGPASSESASATSNPAATAAQSFIDPYLKAPTSITVSEALPEAPAKGKTFVWISCDATTCSSIGSGVKEAAGAAGWAYKELSFKNADPNTLVAALNQALEMSPTAVGFAALPEAVWSSVIPAYQKADVQLVPAVVGPVELNATIPANIFPDASQNTQGKVLANYTIADSNGSAEALLLKVPDLVTLKAYNQGVEEAFASCPSCTLSSVDVSLAQVAGGQVNGVITSQLQRNPNIKYVILPTSEFTEGLPAALQTAGLSDIKIVGTGTRQQDFQDIMSNKASAFVMFGPTYTGWLVVDAALRKAADMTFPEGYGQTPMQLFTKDNTTEAPAEFEEPADFRAQFEKLWKVG